MEFQDVIKWFQDNVTVTDSDLVKLDTLEPGIYMFFTDEEDTETHCLNVNDIASLSWDPENECVTVWVKGKSIQDYPLYPMGGIWTIEIKP